MLLWKNLHSEALASRISGQLPVNGVCCLTQPDWEGLTFVFLTCLLYLDISVSRGSYLLFAAKRHSFPYALGACG